MFDLKIGTGIKQGHGYIHSGTKLYLFSHIGELGLRHKSLFLSSGRENSTYLKGDWQYLACCIRLTWKQCQMTLP